MLNESDSLTGGQYVRVLRVNIPAMSTMGYGWGEGEDGKGVTFAGDHRPMRALGEALQAAAANGEDAPVAWVEDWQVLQTGEDRGQA